MLPGELISPEQVIWNGVPARREPGGAEADVLYGVTMQEQGVTRVLTINLNEVEEELDLL